MKNTTSNIRNLYWAEQRKQHPTRGLIKIQDVLKKCHIDWEYQPVVWDDEGNSYTFTAKVTKNGKIGFIELLSENWFRPSVTKARNKKIKFCLENGHPYLEIKYYKSENYMEVAIKRWLLQNFNKNQQNPTY